MNWVLLAAEEPTISTESRRAPEGMSKHVWVPGVSGEARAEAMDALKQYYSLLFCYVFEGCICTPGERSFARSQVLPCPISPTPNVTNAPQLIIKPLPVVN
jgi:hypothetical protein